MPVSTWSSRERPTTLRTVVWAIWLIAEDTSSISTVDFTGSTRRKYATAATPMETVSRVMTCWDGIGMVTVRRVTFHMPTSLWLSLHGDFVDLARPGPPGLRSGADRPRRACGARQAASTAPPMNAGVAAGRTRGHGLQDGIGCETVRPLRRARSTSSLVGFCRVNTSCPTTLDSHASAVAVERVSNQVVRMRSGPSRNWPLQLVTEPKLPCSFRQATVQPRAMPFPGLRR